MQVNLEQVWAQTLIKEKEIEQKSKEKTEEEDMSTSLHFA
jgi:hypothetical protein